MKMLSDNQVRQLLDVVDRPDFSNTRYRLLNEIARGGMGTVYLAEDTQLERQVAIKVLSTTEDSAEMRERMKREALIIARLEHPGIVPVHDLGVLPDERIFYVMKYVRGQQLDRHVDKTVTLAERMRLFRTTCEAVAFAHARGVVHRDLKPENIMVGPFGEVLVMDWGIARVLRDRENSSTGVSDSVEPLPDTTAHGTILGTPSYMSPEQASGDVESVDRRSDVYSLGSILYFLVTSERPPSAGSETERLAPARSMPRALKRPLAICGKAMSQHRHKRYEDAGALAAEIDSYTDGRPIMAYKENVFELLIRWLDRHRFIVFLILSYILMRTLLILAAGR